MTKPKFNIHDRVYALDTRINWPIVGNIVSINSTEDGYTYSIRTWKECVFISEENYISCVLNTLIDEINGKMINDMDIELKLLDENK